MPVRQRLARPRSCSSASRQASPRFSVCRPSDSCRALMLVFPLLGKVLLGEEIIVPSFPTITPQNAHRLAKEAEGVVNKSMSLNVCMSTKIAYKSNRNVYYSCKYHVVWCPKYRR